MEEWAPSGELARRLEEFQTAGGVVDFAFFRPSPGEAVSLSHHQEAAIGTIRAAERRRPGEPGQEGVPLRIEPEKMKAKRIGLREFLGPRCGPDLRTLAFPGSSASPTWTGFAYAFSDPPYRLASPARLQELFTALTELLFGRLSDLDVVEWSTDWSNYFEPGREWWGSFCWTVYTPHAGHLVGIAASTTD
jgi:hypothetical protein